MPRLVTVLSCFVLNFLLFSAFTHAWTFRWTTEEKETRIINGTGKRNCTVIEMRKGREYKWDPEGDLKCINFFADDKCTPKVKNGWSCPIYGPRRNSQPWVRSFLINEDGDELPPPLGSESSTTSESDDSSKTSTSDSSSTSAATTTSESKSESASPTSSDSDSDSATSSPPVLNSSTPPAGSVTSSPTPTPSNESVSLSGGGIAGAVVGAVAGVGALAGVALFVLRRRRAAPPASESLHSDNDSLPHPHYGSHELSPTTPISPNSPVTVEYYSENGLKDSQRQFISELPANQIAEMGASRGKEQ